MSHWIDPIRRGVYEHPAAPPPEPRHHSQNGIPERMARLEEHISFAAWDRRRSEAESLQRAQDLADSIRALHVRIIPIERHRSRREDLWRLVRSVTTLSKSFVKFAVPPALYLLVITGWMNAEQARAIAGWFGL